MGKPFTGIDAWLNTAENLPKELQEALRHNGVMEIKGKDNNPEIMSWLHQLGVSAWIKNDDIPWCATGVAICAFRAGWLKLPAPNCPSALWWLTQGIPIDIKDAKVGDRGIKKRNGGGHIFYIVGENKTHFRAYGGNQADSWCCVWIAKSDVHAVRRAPFTVQPLGVVKHIYADIKGAKASSEA